MSSRTFVEANKNDNVSCSFRLKLLLHAFFFASRVLEVCKGNKPCRIDSFALRAPIRNSHENLAESLTLSSLFVAAVNKKL